MATDVTGLGSLARRYAAALYDLADSAALLDKVAQDFRQLRAALAESEALRLFIRNPLLDRKEQERGILAVLDRMEAVDLSRRFVGVLVQNHRLFILGLAIDAYLNELAERRGEVVARVTSAAPLTDKQIEHLTTALQGQAGGKMVLDLQIDDELLGGLVVQIGSKLIDNSLKTKLTRLKLAMKGVG